MTNEEFRKLQLACREAGLSNNDAIRIRTAAETGAGSLLKSVLDGNTAGALKAIQAEEAKAAQAKRTELDALADIDKAVLAAMSDSLHQYSEPLLSRQELEAVYQDSNIAEPELSKEELAALEQEIAESMRQPGQPLEDLY